MRMVPFVDPIQHARTMNRTHASFAALAALALLVSATGCTAVSGLQASSSEGNQDKTIIVMGNGISYLGD